MPNFKLHRVVLAAVCAHASTSSLAATEALVQATHKAKVEIVFALDTTGSMGGLLEGAKRKVWAIAKEVQSAQQRPDVRIGLVAFRDVGDEYVTKITPLTSDLDSVYQQLTQLEVGGGGDGPEHVNAALHAAVSQMQWSQGKDTLKMVFLVGDAPPHMDYAQDVRWQTSAQRARHNNIYINTVQCGSEASTMTAWKAIAAAAEGRFAAIAQDGGVSVAIATPYDTDLAGLARDLDTTYLDYGARAARADKKNARAGSSASVEKSPAAAADRAAFKGRAPASPSDDMVALATQSGDASALTHVAEADLPDELRGKSTDEQKRVLAVTARKREALSSAIVDLQRKRDAYLLAKQAELGVSADAFDSEVVAIVKAQGASAGLTY